MKFLEEARAYQDNMIADLRELVKIESVRDDDAATKEAPFGPNIAKCLDKALVSETVFRWKMSMAMPV